MAVKGFDVPLAQQSIPDEQKQFGPWPNGMDNRLPDFSVPEAFLRNAVNVDIDATGRAQTRKGLVKRLSCVGGRGGYGSPFGVFYVDGGTQKLFNGTTSVPIMYGVGNPIAYEQVYDKVYCSDGRLNWAVASDGTVSDWVGSSGGTYITMVEDKMPPGRVITWHFGRLYVAVGSRVYYSEPYAPNLRRPASGYLQFEADVAIFLSVSDGIWCATERNTWWLAGVDPSQFASTPITANPQLNYGGVFGSGTKVPNDNDVVWASQRGAIRASPGGQLKNLQEDHVAVSSANQGASLVKEQDGFRQFLFTIVPTQLSPLAADTWLANEIVRKA